MPGCVLDSSALIATIYKEKGGDVVEQFLGRAAISTVNMAEVLSYIVNRGIKIKEAASLLKDLSLSIEEFTENQSIIAASLLDKTKSRGLSLGDRACIALAIDKNLPAVTADRIWKSIDFGIKVEVIR